MVRTVKNLYWLRRIGALLFSFGIGALITGNTPDWLKALILIAMFGLVLVYDIADYEVKKASRGG